jgi:hypothetical protein
VGKGRGCITAAYPEHQNANLHYLTADKGRLILLYDYTQTKGGTRMSLGLTILTLVHVVISLIGIVSGLVVAYGFLTAKRLDGWTATFLTSTVLTSVTGYFFPVHRLLPSHIVATISLLILALAIYARYGRKLAGGWRSTYVIAAMVALYLNVFVLVVQLFEKVPALKAIAPTQTEAPFKVAQLAVLLLFILLGILATIRFRHEQLRTA